MQCQIVDFHHTARVRGAVVVVDVLRACSTAALAILGGAEVIVPVADAEAGRRLRASSPASLLVGEIGGTRPPDFDVGNSPPEVARESRGRRVILSTGSGAPALARVPLAPGPILAGCFVNAGATARALRGLRLESLTVVVTGTHCGWDGDEDHAFAEYLTRLVRGEQPDPRPYLERVRRSVPARNLLDPRHPEFAPADLACALGLDTADFAMVLRERPGARAIVAL